MAAESQYEQLLAGVRGIEAPDGRACLALARAAAAAGELDAAYRWLGAVVDSGRSYGVWTAAAMALAKLATRAAPPARRAVRIAIAGSYTTSQLGPLLELAGLRRGLAVETYEVGFDLYAQEILDPASALYAFQPDYVLLAAHEGAARFPSLGEDPEQLVEAEARRWQSLWQAVMEHSRARVVQHNFAIRPETVWGHLSARLPAARDEMLRTLNTRLAQAAGHEVLVVDCDRIAAAFGKRDWFDDRYWHLAKQAVALDALPELARHTIAVIAGAEGLSAKCVIVDLDNTLWGGVIGETGLNGIKLGGGSPEGEAHAAFQEYLAALRARGIVLAVVSKNNDADAREPFLSHPDIRLRIDDFAAFLANWEDKAANVRRVAEALSIGLDSLVFVDDNPAEREVVRQQVPGVEVIALPADPSGYTRALSDSLLFELPALTGEDINRAAQYTARAAAASLQQQATSLDEFYASLGMQALVAPFDELNLPRIAQLVGKTNQFNLTTRRHGLAELTAFAEDPRYVTLYLRLRDNFADHGLVAVLVARHDGDGLDIDTWLMSCRVIGRTVENEMLKRLCEAALARGATRLTGTYLPTAKNGLVGDLYARMGFRLLVDEDGATTWEYDIDEQGIVQSEFIGSWDEDLAHA